MKNKPLISVITVVYNGVESLERTIKSVINQTYDRVEYIVIDGGSTDGTVDVIKKYQDRIAYWVSERDKGIYDAMNKGIGLVNGDWINFMNSGDSFLDELVLNKIFEKEEYKDIEVIYGDHKVIYPNRTSVVKAGNVQDIWKGSQFCHQSAFISTRLHKSKKYNLLTRIGADFEFFYNLYKSGARFKYIHEVIADYTSGGVSDVRRLDSIVGWWNVVEKNFKTNIHYIWIISKEILKNWVKRFVK